MPHGSALILLEPACPPIFSHEPGSPGRIESLSVSAEPASKSSRWVRLNQFQRMMLRWNHLHPYNAVHVVRIPASFDLERLKASLGSTLQSLKLGEVILNRST